MAAPLNWHLDILPAATYLSPISLRFRLETGLRKLFKHAKLPGRGVTRVRALSKSFIRVNRWLKIPPFLHKRRHG